MRRFFSALMLGLFAAGFCVGCGEEGGDAGEAEKPATEEAEEKTE